MLDSRDDRKRLGLNRLLAFRVMIFALFGLLLLQLARLQIVNGTDYEERAQNNSIAILKLPAERGIITDRNGVPLVQNIPGYDAVAIPGRVRDSERREILYRLADLFGIPAERMDRQITEGEEEALFAPVILKENLTRDEALVLRELEPEMRGIELQIAPSRLYEEGQLLAPIVGYIGPINEEEYEAGLESDEPYGLGDRLGRQGIERIYEDELRGVDGRKLVEQDALGRQLRLVEEEEPVPGDRVVLALDYSLQTETAKAVAAAMETFSAAIGSAVVLNVNTGEVLAMVSLPSYDANIFTEGVAQSTLNKLEEDTDGRPLVNHAIQDTFAPGSVFKVITAAAALEHGSATPETRLNSAGYLDVKREAGDGDPLRFRDTAQGTFTFPQGIAVSSNVYFYCLVAADQPGSQFFVPGCGPDEIEGIGPGNLARMSHAFGLGAPTGVDLPGEASGTVPPADQDGETANVDDDVGDTIPEGATAETPAAGLSNLSAWFANLYASGGGAPGEPWRMGTTLQFAIGQNVVTTTPLQMATVTAAIANGGRVLQPRLVHEIIDADGVPQGYWEADDGRRVQLGVPIVRNNLPVSAENLAVIRQGMWEAVNAQYGTATVANPTAAGVQIAGKTGSPQIQETDPGTGKLKTHAWFIGFGPFENPEIAVVVYIQGGTGAEAAAPVAKAIFEAWFARVNVRSVQR